MRKKLEGLCVNVSRASFYLGAVVLALLPLRWLLLTGRLVAQVIAVLLTLGLVVAWVYGLVLLVRRHRPLKEETRCYKCDVGSSCPGYDCGVVYPCPYFRSISRFRKTKPAAGRADQISAADPGVLQK